MRASLATTLLAILMLSACAGPAPAPQERPRNVLFFLGDGLGLNTLTAARIYAVGEDGELTIDTLPESAFVKTYSQNAQVTDSAASMSSYMTGVKVNSGVISMTADTVWQADTCNSGRAVPTLAELARRRGLAVGIVTNTSVTDATPAAVYAHICNRDLEAAIATALVPGGAGFNPAFGTRGPDLVLGGGMDLFATRRADERILLDELRAGRTQVVTTAAQLEAAQPEPGQPLIGLFAARDMDYEAERDPARQPGLGQMTAKAIALLSKNPNGFFLVVEGGLIDNALHDTLAKRALQETVVFDTTVKAAIAQMRALDPGLKNTLIVVTADHDHTLFLNGYARRTGKTTPTEPGVLGLVRRVDNGEPRRDADGAPFTIIGFGNGPNRVQGNRAAAPQLTDAIVTADDYRQEAVIRMKPGEETHGGNDVYLGAIGAGAERFRGTIDNTRVFELIREAAAW